MAASVAYAPSALAQDRVDIRFEPGATSTAINGTVRGDEYIDYVVNARGGQTMVVSLAVTGTNGNGSAYFNILPAGQDYGGPFIGSSEGRRAEITVPSDGDWAIRVYLMGNDRDTGKTVGYSMDVYIAPSGAAGGSGSSSASMPSGPRAALPPNGPAFWDVRVTGSLNVRQAPSTSATIVARLPSGMRVENRGCLDNEGRTWCEIADGDASGWAVVDFLMPASGASGENTATADDGGGAMAGALPSDIPTVTGDVRVQFAPGTSGARYINRLGSGQAVTYVLNARDGQFLTVDLQGETRNLDYIIYVPSGNILDQASQSSFRYYGQLYQSGDHRVEVFYNGNQGTYADFAITFEIR
ncbi:SH3 domain-containing protein [Rhodovulum iodosum]|uniref:SH3 domain-containing protein n=1 Tax=Rhodovulum iodosum TaxID=68291 RepID=UPI001FE8FB6B|nr:SH3 domain-containing protein [Rhodovulum robiginosum]